MLRYALLLTAGLALLPTSAFADGTDCPLHKRLDAQKAVQSAELSPVTVSTPIVEAPVISTPRQVAAATPVPSPAAATERGVDVIAVPVQIAENTAQTSYGSGTPEVKATPKKEMTMTKSPHADWTDILQSYVSAPDDVGLTHFDYAGLKANMSDKAKLDGYIKSLEATSPDGLTDNEAIAFYANLYNAVTIQVVADNYPVKSIRKLGPLSSGPWKKDLFTLNGKAASLDTVEHKILRVKYPSPYVHYMVNCASVGCPNLPNSAWEAGTLETLRKDAASDYINSPRGVIVTSKGLKVSSIYKWFKEDFGGKAGALKHIREHADADLAAAIDGGAKITDYGYDWSLNK